MTNDNCPHRYECYDYKHDHCDGCNLARVKTNAEVETSKIEYKAYNEGFKDGVEQGIKLSERPQGKWIRQYGKSYKLITTDEGTLIGEFTKCPKCLYDKARGSNFCPNCGADMRGEEK